MAREQHHGQLGALRGGLLGAAVVGVTAGLLAYFVIWPAAGYHFSLTALPLVVIAASLFGFIAGAVAGASEEESGEVGPAPVVKPARQRTARMRAKTSSGSPTPSTSVTMPLPR